MSAKRRRTMEDKDIAQKLFLDSSSEDENMSHDSDSDSNQDESQEDNTDWRENTQSGCGAPVIHRFIGGPSGMPQCSSYYKQGYDPPERLHALFSGNYPAAGGRD
jgi:hypothetical protein